MRAVSMVVFCVIACGGHSEIQSKWPARPEGCDIKIFRETPPFPTDNIGHVQAVCDQDRISENDCMRELKDQACKIGADLMWEVPMQPSYEYGKQVWSARAAHTRK